ncbi:hypothetical protein HOLleu_18591 [Holothuria leucospilota]|uniref:Uncharacterized protein n=1 Tax=Holothuria leucospilota TaxID=206669 RepID=A0A9Q1C4B8_HOLLE|nr:hypothetical protein HOLleu_18591 [Holothuria leucospilota]
MRPTDPVDLAFDIDKRHTPTGFLWADIIVGENRRIMFATDEQLNLLGKAKVWYVDATFNHHSPNFSPSMHSSRRVKVASATAVRHGVRQEEEGLQKDTKKSCKAFYQTNGFSR